MMRFVHGSCLLLVLAACKGSTLDLGENSPPEAIIVVLKNTTAQNLGVNGRLREAMSTSFQPAPWQYQFFDLHPDAGADLKALTPQHIHIQALDRALPWKAKTDQPDADWDFGELDKMVPPILAADPGAMFQIMPPPALAASFSGNSLTPAVENDFATYCGNLVQYYNQGSFFYPNDSGTAIANPKKATQPISWWGILGDFNTTYSMSTTQYQELYDIVVPKMVAANGDAGALHFSAFEYSDNPNGSGPAALQSDVALFLANVHEFDALSLHAFSALSRENTDQEIFGTVPRFASGLHGVYAQMEDAGAEVSETPIWVTQNNVDSDYPTEGGVSNWTQEPFRNDTRGTDRFFAAWRPYVFSQLGKAGNRALYHWDYTAGNIAGSSNPDTDLQNAEVDYASGKPLISYWVDYWLGRMFPATETSPPLDILELTDVDGGTSDFDALASSDGVEVLATKNECDNTVVVMIVDFATEGSPAAAATVQDGNGAARRVEVDISAFQPLASGTLREIFDPTVDNGPEGNPAIPVDVTRRTLTVDLQGYGVAFLKLVPGSACDSGIAP